VLRLRRPVERQVIRTGARAWRKNGEGESISARLTWKLNRRMTTLSENMVPAATERSGQTAQHRFISPIKPPTIESGQMPVERFPCRTICRRRMSLHVHLSVGRIGKILLLRSCPRCPGYGSADIPSRSSKSGLTRLTRRCSSMMSKSWTIQNGSVPLDGTAAST
jgi:hypothetical protein